MKRSWRCTWNTLIIKAWCCTSCRILSWHSWCGWSNWKTRSNFFYKISWFTWLRCWLKVRQKWPWCLLLTLLENDNFFPLKIFLSEEKLILSFKNCQFVNVLSFAKVIRTVITISARLRTHNLSQVSHSIL